MYELVAINEGLWSVSLLKIFLVAVVFFAFSMVAMVFLFGLSTRDISKNFRGLVVLAILSLSVPLGVFWVQKPTNLFPRAAISIEVTAPEVVPVDGGRVLVSFTTSEPALAYIEYRDATGKVPVPCLPTYTLEERTQHSVLIEGVSEQGGEAWVVLNGRRYLVGGTFLRIRK